MHSVTIYTFLRLLSNYEVIYEVIMRKFRVPGLDEAPLGLEIQ